MNKSTNRCHPKGFELNLYNQSRRDRVPAAKPNLNGCTRRWRRAIRSALMAILFGGSLVSSVAEAQHAPAPKPNAALTQGEHYAQLPEVKIWYRVAGHGPLLVITSPQWGVGAENLQTSMNALEQHFTVAYVDARGNGKSSRPTNPDRVSTLANTEDLDGLRRHWGLDKLNILGHSGGGSIVLGYAERYPEHVNKLIMVDAEVTDLYPSPDQPKILKSWEHDPEHATFVSHWHDPFDSDESFERFIKNILGLYLYQPSKTLPLLENAFKGPPATHLHYWTFANWTRDETLHPMKQSKELDKVQAKTLIIVGRHDFICPVSMSEQAAKGIAGSRLVIFEQSGHFAWIEEPGKFFPLVTQFLEN